MGTVPTATTTAAARRATRTATKMRDRYAAAGTELDRLAVAADFLRAAAAATADRDPVGTDLVLGDAVRHLLRAGESLLDRLDPARRSRQETHR